VCEAGVTFNNSFFDTSFVLVGQLKNRSFLGPFLYMSLVEIRINGTKSGQQLCLINVLFDFFPTGYWSNKTLVEHNCCPDLVRLILISTFYFFRLG
jgi:hypothetical protein